MTELSDAKRTVLDFHARLDAAPTHAIKAVLSQHVTSDWHWRGLHPFGELSGAEAVADTFWVPFRSAFAPVQRRPDVFFAGHNEIDGEHSTWVLSMGHLLGLFDKPWLGIPPTGRMLMFRYAEFNCVRDGRICETAFFFDLLSVMAAAGHYPLPPATGAMIVSPGPRTHDGLLTTPHAPDEGRATLALVNRMIDDLSALNAHENATGDSACPPEVLARCWHDDMIWYGPAGIGAAYTIPRYQRQHQYPFREGLTDKRFNGHVARIAEGNYAAFFGWPNLSNRATGGFLGLPEARNAADMRVVDVYRRDGDKLAENWVFIDIAHYLDMQGLDVLARMRAMLPD